MSGYEWVSCSKGDQLPKGAVMAGETSSDGVNFVCRVNGEAGKVNLEGESINHFWCHGGVVKSESGDILCISEGYAAHWQDASKGDSLPSGAVCAGSTASDGDNYVCRTNGAAGKVNLDGDRLHNFWVHGAWFAKEQGDVLVVKACGSGSHSGPASEGHGRDWWQPGADCGGSSAEDRANWLMQNEGYSQSAARLKVKSEFPGRFHGGGDFVNCKFPHGLSLVDTADGPRLKLDVVCNRDNVALVAVHYQVNDGAPMNFDVRQPDGGSRTYRHVTPNGGGYPLCRDGDRVSYWLAAEIDGLIEEEPEGACPNPAARMQWTAHH
jgi:hypothetical protein